MEGSVQPENQQPNNHLDSWGALARYAIARLIDVVCSDKSPWVIISPIVLVLTYHILFIYSLPQADRLSAGASLVDVVDSIKLVLDSNAFNWLGWILFAVLLLFFWGVGTVFFKRIQSQGDRIKGRRDGPINERVSSRDEVSLGEYDVRMKQRYGGHYDTDDN